MTNGASAWMTGKFVVLRSPTREDAEGAWHSWFNDPETSRFLNQWRPNSVDKQLEFLETRVKNSGDVILSVVERETGKHVGVSSISRIDWVNRFADVAIVIGDSDARSKAVIGFEAFALTVRAAFLKLNLENLKGGYIAGQTHSAAILKAMRFREVGTMQGLFVIDGKRMDQILVQLSRTEWLKRNRI